MRYKKSPQFEGTSCDKRTLIGLAYCRGGEYALARGGSATAQHSYCTLVSQTEAQPGDLAFYPDDSHVGIVVGRSGDGKLLVCHCSSGQNNVVVTEFAASGFTVLGRPDAFQ